MGELKRTGLVEVTFSYRRAAGGRSVHGGVTLRLDPALQLCLSRTLAEQRQLRGGDPRGRRGDTSRAPRPSRVVRGFAGSDRLGRRQLLRARLSKCRGRSNAVRLSILAAPCSNACDTVQTKTPPPEGDGVLYFEHRKRKISCPWQAWQRPTLPGLKP